MIEDIPEEVKIRLEKLWYDTYNQPICEFDLVTLYNVYLLGKGEK